MLIDKVVKFDYWAVVVVSSMLFILVYRSKYWFIYRNWFFPISLEKELWLILKITHWECWMEPICEWWYLIFPKEIELSAVYIRLKKKRNKPDCVEIDRGKLLQWEGVISISNFSNKETLEYHKMWTMIVDRCLKIVLANNQSIVMNQCN